MGCPGELNVWSTIDGAVDENSVALPRSLRRSFSSCSQFGQRSSPLLHVLHSRDKDPRGASELGANPFRSATFGSGIRTTWLAIRSASCSYLSFGAMIRSLA